jgi:anti-anti-sigma factor
MQTSQFTNKSVKVIKPRSELDLLEIEEEILGAVSASEILLDLSGLDYINSAFIALLLRIKNGKRLLNRKLVLVNPNEIVNEILSMTQLDRVFEIQKIYPTAW